MQAQSTDFLNRTCEQCGTRFHATASELASGRGRRCSRACFTLYRRGRPLATSRWPSAQERFWSHVRTSDDPHACRLWHGATNPSGYGVIYAEGRRWLAHRYAWHFLRGPIPTGMFICHRCDVPACIFIDHLFLGTVADNQRDMVAKGRQATGDRHGSRTHPDNHWSKRMPERITRHERHGMAKLTADDVRQIRRLGPTTTPTELGRQFGVTPQNIHRILSGKTWKGV